MGWGSLTQQGRSISRGVSWVCGQIGGSESCGHWSRIISGHSVVSTLDDCRGRLGQNRRTVGKHCGLGQDTGHDGHQEHNDLGMRRRQGLGNAEPVDNTSDLRIWTFWGMWWSLCCYCCFEDGSMEIDARFRRFPSIYTDCLGVIRSLNDGHRHQSRILHLIVQRSAFGRVPGRGASVRSPPAHLYSTRTRLFGHLLRRCHIQFESQVHLCITKLPVVVHSDVPRSPASNLWPVKVYDA